MISYDTIQHARETVLHTLSREGGELSHSEIVLSTRLPYDVVAAVIDQLKQKGIVKIQRAADAKIETVRLV